MAQLSIRIEFGTKNRLGPGKIMLLEMIRDHGSISAAGRAMDMSYRRAWMLVENLNLGFGQAVVDAKIGGSRGGGASLTPFGSKLIREYRSLEAKALAMATPHIEEIEHSPPGRKPRLDRKRRPRERISTVA